MKKWSEIVKDIKFFQNSKEIIYRSIFYIYKKDDNAKNYYSNNHHNSKYKMNGNFSFMVKNLNYFQMDSFKIHYLVKFNKTTNHTQNSHCNNLYGKRKNYNKKTRFSNNKLAILIKNGLSKKKYIKQIEFSETNLFHLFKIVTKMKIIRIIIILITLYFLIFKVRLFRFTLSRMFYRFSSEPRRVIYEFYYGSKFNIYFRNLISDILLDEEVQKGGTKYLIELLVDESFIQSISRFIKHLLVKILSEERLLDIYSNRLLNTLQSERFNKELKKFIDDTVKRDEIRSYIIKMVMYFVFRKESSDAIKQFLESGFKEFLYDPDHAPNALNLIVDAFTSNIIRRRYIENYNKHYLNDYPDEKDMHRVLELIKDDDYNLDNKNENMELNKIIQENHLSSKPENSKFDIEFIRKLGNNKEQYEFLYKYNNYYTDGYLNKDNPKKIRERILELCEIFKNIKYMDVTLNPDFGTYTDFATHLDRDYYKLMIDKVLLRNDIIMKIHKNGNKSLYKFIKEKLPKSELFFNENSFESQIDNKRKDLKDLIVNLDLDIYDSLQGNEIGQYKYKERFYQKNSFDNLRFIFRYPQPIKHSSILLREFPINRLKQNK